MSRAEIGKPRIVVTNIPEIQGTLSICHYQAAIIGGGYLWYGRLQKTEKAARAEAIKHRASLK